MTFNKAFPVAPAFLTLSNHLLGKGKKALFPFLNHYSKSHMLLNVHGLKKNKKTLKKKVSSSV